jgi:colanic acid biosynthesis glycosyl transferase WcaI
MKVQLWSYNYDPEPTGIAPVSSALARFLAGRGHDVQVVAAHPHYPRAVWGRSRRPYRETRDGVSMLRLPLWIGRQTSRERLVQEASFALAQSLALPALGRPDVAVSVSPSFPALLPALVNARVRGVPWVLWIQDLLPEGAVTTGVLDEGPILTAARRLESAAYRAASRIVVVSDTFRRKLVAQGVPARAVELVYNPATRPQARPVEIPAPGDGMRILSMGNIGHSQGLAELVAAFERAPAADTGAARLLIAGDGVAAEDVRAAIRSDRVEMLGLVSDERLETELRSAALGLVSQRADVAEFNLPSKLMNFLAYGIPVIALVAPGSEVARLVQESGGGSVVDSADMSGLTTRAGALLRDRDQRERMSRAGFAFAQERLTPEVMGARFERLLGEVVRGGKVSAPGADGARA